MNIEEIRKNAPDGATHYRIGSQVNIIYYKAIDFDDLYFYRPKHNIWSITGNTLKNNEIKPLV